MSTSEAHDFAWSVAGNVTGFLATVAVLLLGLSLLGLVSKW